MPCIARCSERACSFIIKFCEQQGFLPHLLAVQWTQAPGRRCLKVSAVSEGKTRSDSLSFGAAFDADLAVVSFDDRLADRQTQSAAAFLPLVAAVDLLETFEIASLNGSGTPRPMSSTEILAPSSVSSAAMITVESFGENLIAFESKLIKTCTSRSASAISWIF